MRSNHDSMTVSSMIFGAPIIRSLSSRGLVAIIALAVGLAASSPCFSQTTNLGQAGQYSVFEVSQAGVTPGSFNVTNSSIDGSVALGAGTSFSALSTTIGGAVYEDSNVSVSSSGTTVAGGDPVTDLTAAAIAAANAWTTAAALAANNSFSNNSITGNTGPNASPVNVVNFGQGLILSGATLTINGTSSEQFVFNVSQDLILSDTSIVLNGVSASNVLFNITGGTGIVSIYGGTFSGDILDLAGSSSVSLTGGVMDGSIISDGTITVSNSSIVLPSEPDVTLAPELPTSMTAGLACLLIVLWHAGRNLLRRRRLSLAVAPDQS